MRYRFAVLVGVCVWLVAGRAHAQRAGLAPLAVNGPVRAAQHGPGGIPYRILENEPKRRNGIGYGPKSSTTSLPPHVFYPGDLTNPDNGPTVVTTQFHPVYVDNVPSHWGDVGTFLTDLGQSDFIHVVDQYTGSKANNRYNLGTTLSVNYPIPANHTLTFPDLDSIAHAAALSQGAGLGHIYSVFLPQGVDFCASPFDCYSPDNESTWTFCAFHTYELFDDIADPVLVTLQPYADVPGGCSVPPTGGPNSQLIDSTNNILSHEVFETITDPLVTAWWIHTIEWYLFGAEVGDLCVKKVNIGGVRYSGAGNVNLNGHAYMLQAEYSNIYHACVYTPQP
jgi:hypothetical protein